MTKSRSKKLRERILDSLNNAVELSINKGKVVQSQFTKPNKKVRRHSGRYTPRLSQKGKFSEMIANAEEPQEEYDDWIERRDGFRNKLSKEEKEKIKKQVARRRKV